MPDNVDLLNHLVGPQQQRGRDAEAEGLRRFDVDNEFELGGLLDGKVSRPRTLKNPRHKGGGVPDIVGKIWPVGHEAAVDGVVAGYRDGRQSLGSREIDNSLPVDDVYWSADYENAIQPLIKDVSENGVEVLGSSHIERPDRGWKSRLILQIPQRRYPNWVARMPKRRYVCERGGNF